MYKYVCDVLYSLLSSSLVNLRVIQYSASFSFMCLLLLSIKINFGLSEGSKKGLRRAWSPGHGNTTMVWGVAAAPLLHLTTCPWIVLMPTNLSSSHLVSLSFPHPNVPRASYSAGRRDLSFYRPTVEYIIFGIWRVPVEIIIVLLHAKMSSSKYFSVHKSNRTYYHFWKWYSLLKHIFISFISCGRSPQKLFISVFWWINSIWFYIQLFRSIVAFPRHVPIVSSLCWGKIFRKMLWFHWRKEAKNV